MASIDQTARALFALCAVAAGMELLVRDERGALAFRSLCALAVATGAARLLLRLLGV